MVSRFWRQHEVVRQGRRKAEYAGIFGLPRTPHDGVVLRQRRTIYCWKGHSTFALEFGGMSSRVGRFVVRHASILVPLPAIDSAFLAEHDAVMRRPQSAKYARIFGLPASLPDDLVLSPVTRDHSWKGH